jgi:hypothetical protein
MKKVNLDTLKGSADKVENFTHFVPFTEDELNERKTNLSEEMITADDLEQQFKLVKDAHKEKMKPINRRISNLLLDIRSKGTSITEEAFIMYEGEFAVYHDAEGIEIYKRPLMASEKQQPTVYMEIRKEGTNN